MYHGLYNQLEEERIRANVSSNHPAISFSSKVLKCLTIKTTAFDNLLHFIISYMFDNMENYHKEPVSTNWTGTVLRY